MQAERYSLRRAFGKIAHQKGLSSENLTKVALKDLSESVGWVNDFRRANRLEDRKKGIDFVVETDVGKIFLQIKSSQTGKENSLKKHPKIPVIIVNNGFKPEEIREVIITTLSEQRNFYLIKRKNGFPSKDGGSANQ